MKISQASNKEEFISYMKPYGDHVLHIIGEYHHIRKDGYYYKIGTYEQKHSASDKYTEYIASITDCLTLIKNAKQEVRKEKLDEYNEKFANPYMAASKGYIDEVIFPEDTRQKIAEALDLAYNKRETTPPRKHGNIPL